MNPLLIILTFTFSTLSLFAGATLPPITKKLLKEYKDSAKVFEGTISKVEKKYILNGREYKITDEQLEKLKMEAYTSAKPEDSTYMKLRVIHRFTLQVVGPISENVQKEDKIVLEIIDHPDSMCPHYKAFPQKNRLPEFLPEPNVWMLYQKSEKLGILREEHAFLSQEDWKALKSKNNEQDDF